MSEHIAQPKFGVPVRTELQGRTFVTFERIARERRTTVAQLLSELADKAIEPRVPADAPRKWVRMTPGLLNQLVTLAQAGNSNAAIARELGVSEQSVRNHRRRLSLN